MVHRRFPALLVVALVLSGCTSALDPARIPGATLEEHGWHVVRENRTSIANGAAEQALLDYRPESDENRAGVLVVSASDVPMLDEGELVPFVLEQASKANAIEMDENGSTRIELANLDARVNATAYNVTSAPAPASGLVFHPPCTAFAVVLAWGTTQTARPGRGGDGGGRAFFDEARSVARDVTCS